MGVKCTHYKLCSVQSKLVYFSQFRDMKHFLGPVWDIRPCSKLYRKYKIDAILWFIWKVIGAKGCYDSCILWKFYMISTFCTEMASTYSTAPSKLFRLQPKNMFKMFRILLTFPIHCRQKHSFGDILWKFDANWTMMDKIVSFDTLNSVVEIMQQV